MKILLLWYKCIFQLIKFIFQEHLWPSSCKWPTSFLLTAQLMCPFLFAEFPLKNLEGFFRHLSFVYYDRSQWCYNATLQCDYLFIHVFFSRSINNCMHRPVSPGYPPPLCTERKKILNAENVEISIVKMSNNVIIQINQMPCPPKLHNFTIKQIDVLSDCLAILHIPSELHAGVLITLHLFVHYPLFQLTLIQPPLHSLQSKKKSALSSQHFNFI